MCVCVCSSTCLDIENNNLESELFLTIRAHGCDHLERNFLSVAFFPHFFDSDA